MPELTGIVPPLVTPLNGRDELDLPGLERLLERVISGGVSGLFLLGTTGEAPSLSYRLRKELIHQACRLVDGRVPVLVGITDTAVVESLTVASWAAEAGATAVVTSTPYYFPAGQTELLAYIERLVTELPLPLMLYNMPSMTKVWFEEPTVERLLQVDQIIGIKDSSGDMGYFERMLMLKRERPEWTVLMGPENLMVKSVQRGGSGGVSGGANVFPKLFVDAYQAAKSGDAVTITRLQAKIDELQAIYSIGKYASRHIKATKCALSILEVCDDFMAEPFHHFKEPERERVAHLLKTFMATSEELVG